MQIGEKYEHYRTGKVYEVIDIGGADDGAVATVRNRQGKSILIKQDEFLKAHRWIMDEKGEPVVPPKWEPKVGDVVRLKCGGPPMVVRSITHYDKGATISVMWHLDYGRIERDDIFAELLVPVEPALLGGDVQISRDDIHDGIREMLDR